MHACQFSLIEKNSVKLMSSGPGSLGMWALSWGGPALLESSAATFPAVAFKFFCLLINIWNLPRVAHTRSRDIAIGADPWGVQALVVFFFFPKALSCPLSHLPCSGEGWHQYGGQHKPQ